MSRILIEHERRYPDWQIDDLYKLVQQAALGSEHALKDEGAARDWLRRELAELGPGPAEPLLDPISPEGRIVRVHLRPLVEARLDPEPLLRAFIRTAREFPSNPARLIEYAGAARQLAQQGQLSFDPAAVAAFFLDLENAGFPAVHHSAAFEAAYAPAYRVVARETLPPEVIAAA